MVSAKYLKVMGVTLLTSVALSSVVSPATTTVAYASEIESATIAKAQDEEAVISSLEQKGYLAVDIENQSVRITEKYKQDVINSVDTNMYNVKFTSNSVELIPKMNAKAFTGVTKIVYTWKGFDLYLNSGDANRVAAGLGIGAALSALIPDPVASKIVAVALGVAAGLIAYNNADGRGVIIAFIGLPGQNDVPHWITSQ